MATIRAEDGSSFHAETNWIMAALLLGAAGAVAWFFRATLNLDFNSPDFNPVIILPVFLGAYGLNHLVRSIVGTLRVKLFGVSVLEIEGASVRMGQTIDGVVRTAVELQPTSDYEIRLQCIETFEMGAGSRNSVDDSTRNVDRIRWEQTVRVAADSVKSKSGIPFRFTLPQPFGKSEPSSTSPVIAGGIAAINIPGLQRVFARNEAAMATRWIVEIKAPRKGLDYYAIFGVIVDGSTADRGITLQIPLG